MEKQCQDKIIKVLKAKKCFVLKTKPGLGTPVGTPDILFFLEGFWGAIEVKASAKAPFQPLQKERIEQFNEWSWARVVYPENLSEILDELNRIL